VPAGFHAHPHFQTLFLQLLVELFGFLAMHQASFAQFPGVAVHKRNLLEARMIVTASEPFGCFAPPKSTRAWKPTLSLNHYTHNRLVMSVNA
jgi:hypothetical protein